MNQINQINNLPSDSAPGDEVNLLDYWRVGWKRRRLIGGLFVSALLTALVVSLLMPKIYESTATLLPSLESKDGGGLGALLAASGAGGTAQSLGISLPGAPATPNDIFVAMLKSRIMAEDRKSTRLNSSHVSISYAVFCLKKKKK